MNTSSQKIVKMSKENNIEVLAFYLPQYYPTKENNEWYGPGFTEWTNVGKAKPLYRGHYQPKVPADLGYYDLRVPEVRELQANLAKEAGVSAFCYYHYWFGNGREMLEYPLKEVVRLKSPDFPFCICWANHSWYRKTWDASANTLNKVPLMEQLYPGEEDVVNHFYSLLDCFKDERYYKSDGKLVFVIYHIDEMPDAKAFIEKWQELAAKEGLPPFAFYGYTDDITRTSHMAFSYCDRIIVSCKYNIDALGNSRMMRKASVFAKSWLSRLLMTPLNKWDYAKVRKKLLDERFKEESIIPVLYPNWDNTPRRDNGALILYNSTPEQFKQHCKDVFGMIRNKSNKTVFIKSWNEWGEGNYMEPCLKYGHGYIHALKEALAEY